MSDPRLRPDQVGAMRAMLVSATQAPAAKTRAPLMRRVGFGALAAGAVGAVAAIVAAVTVVAPAGAPGDPSVQASTMLRDAAASTADPEPGDGQFLRLATSASYLALTTVDDTTIGYLESQLREVYLPADAADETVAQTTYVEPTVFFGTGAEEFAARDRIGQTDVVTVGASPADATKPVEDQAAMPRDPSALLDYLVEYRYQAGSSDENVFAHVVDLLRTGTVTSDLRAALYRALALMPAVVVTEERAEIDGRVGTAIGLRGTAGDTRQEIIIEPSTGDYIGVRLVTIDGFGQIPAGTALEYTALSTSVVNSVPR
jgi:hypothetical protein